MSADALDVLAAVAKLLSTAYGVALAVAILWLGPRALRVGAGIEAAIREHNSLTRDRDDRLSRQVEEIHAAVVGRR